MIGGACLYVRNKAQIIGDMVDGKRTWSFRPKSLVRRPIPNMGTGYKGLIFVPNSGNLPEVLSSISYIEIIMIGSTVFTVYRSGKLIIRAFRSIYRYINKKFTPKLNYSYVVRFTAEYLIDSFDLNCINKINKIYSVALQLYYNDAMNISLFNPKIYHKA
jgi:hypothetical protein